ncbi:hypothetical protein ACN5O6_12575, partial [Aliarcobacter butzleri]
VPEFEQMLVKSGMILFIFHVSVSKKEQLKRFKKREIDTLKQYKLSPVDKESHNLSQNCKDSYMTLPMEKREKLTKLL